MNFLNQDKKKNKYSKVAMLIHPLNVFDFISKDMKNFYPYLIPFSRLMKLFSLNSIKNFIPKMPSHVLFKINEINFEKNRKIGFLGITFPFFPDQMVAYDHAFILKKIISACDYAASLGARIVVLAGFTSIVCNEGEELVGKTKIAVTSGNTFTAALCLDGISKAANLMEKKIEDSSVAIIGATGDIGSACAKVLSKKAKSLILCARRISDSDDFVRQLKSSSKSKIILETSSRIAGSNADIVLTATSALSPILDVYDLKKGAILCDVSMPPNIAKEDFLKRDDVFIFNGGKAKFNSNVQFSDSWNKLMPNNSIFGCLAEGFVLALEGMFENFSIGRNKITESSLERILSLGLKNDITLANFCYGDKVYTSDDIAKIKENSKK